MVEVWVSFSHVSFLSWKNVKIHITYCNFRSLRLDFTIDFTPWLLKYISTQTKFEYRGHLLYYAQSKAKYILRTPFVFFNHSTERKMSLRHLFAHYRRRNPCKLVKIYTALNGQCSRIPQFLHICHISSHYSIERGITNPSATKVRIPNTIE